MDIAYRMRFVLRYRLAVLLLMLHMLPAEAASKTRKLDPAYIEDHTKDLTVRAFVGNSFSSYRLDQRGFDKALVYKSNDNLNIGIGFNYRFVGLNIAVRAPVINNDHTRFGKTRRIDFQPHIYARKFTVDAYAQLTRGFYIKDKGILSTPLPAGKFFIRPDLRTSWFGANAHYIFNHKRFSYRAAFTQNEYQKKSAGSVVVGAGMHYFSTHADSAIIPSELLHNDLFGNSSFNRSRVFFMAVNAGYAQTVVIKKHFFITSALVGGIGFNVSALTDEKVPNTNKETNLQLNGLLRLAAGYNSSKYYVGIQYMDYLTQFVAPVADSWQEFEAGNIRIVIAIRFPIRRDLIKDVYEMAVPAVN